MPSPQKLPDPTAWRHVLVHRTARHGSSILVSGNEEVARSFLSLHHGTVKPTVVIRSRHLYERTMRIGGWEDITPEVGPLTPKCWDEEKGKWKLDPEGFLPWERRPGEKATPLPVEVEAAAEEEVPLVEESHHPPKPQPAQPTPEVKPPESTPEMSDPASPAKVKPAKKPSVKAHP